MGQHVDVGVGERALDAAVISFRGLLEARVDGREDEVELAGNLVGEIERAVGEDVALAAGEDADRGWPGWSARICRTCSRSLSGERPPATVDDREWSETITYS